MVKRKPKLSESSIARISALRDKDGPPTTDQVRRGLALYESLIAKEGQQPTAPSTG